MGQLRTLRSATPIDVNFDYSRQVLLKEIGAEGQALLKRARVLVVGAGGLGSPVLQYLAGAGVGTIGIIDDDTLDATNLHRQPLYAFADIGRTKVELAKRAISALNPSILVDTFRERFGSINAESLVQQYDVVIDCSDNFTTKYAINDAAVLSHRVAVFASVYQYEGQLHVYKPESGHACLRCLWPVAAPDGIIGNCAEAGVLGPVPGIIGALQSLLTLKILLKMPGQLREELLLLDFNNFSQLKIKAARRAECIAPHCKHIRAMTQPVPNLEVVLDSLDAARLQGLSVIDIRTVEEITALPSGLQHIPMDDLLHDPQLLPTGANIVLLCASGKRSLATASELYRRGIRVTSLVGGLQHLKH